MLWNRIETVEEVRQMHKYWEISKIYMKTQLVYRADVLFNMIFTVGKILFAYLLWGVIFQNRTMVGDFTFSGMLSYYIISSFLSQLDMSRGISEEIHERMRNGTFSKYMIVPVNIQRYFVSMELGIELFYLAFDLVAAVVWVLIFRIQFTFVQDILTIFYALVLILLGFFFMKQLNYYLGILTLKYQGIGTFLMIKNNIVALVTGTIVPLALFPEMVVKVMRVLPFYYVTYLPSMLLTGHCVDEALTGIAVLLLWCIAIQLLIRITWKRYIRKYDGVGV